MKKLSTLFIASACAALLGGCLNEKLNGEIPSPVESGKGYLSLSGLSVECVADHQSVDQGVNDVRPMATRTEVNINDFTCDILEADGATVVMSFRYGDRPTSSIALDNGNYFFRMMSGEIPGAEWENPVYGIVEPFTITRKATTTLDRLVCTLQNIQVSVSYSADLLAALSDDTTTTITVGANSKVFALTETRSAYFYAAKVENDIDVLVKGSYTPEGKTEASTFEMNATIKGVKAGQYSDIKLYLEYSTEGSISIGATIDGWVVDDEIICDFSSSLAETIIDDEENRPTFSFPGLDLSMPVTLADNMFDGRGNCVENMYVDVTAENGLAALVVNISSTSAEFLASLASYGIPTTIDMCNAGSAATMLRLLGYATGDSVIGQTSVSYNMTSQMSMLRDFGGTHTFAVTARDAKGLEAEQSIVLVVPTDEVGPVIKWLGYNIDQRYEMVSGMTVDIVIDAPAGVKEFVVTIQSDTLTPAELRGVGLCDNLDLVDPDKSFDSENPTSTDTSQVASALNNFGFPSGVQVKDQPRVEFSITKFLDLLAVTGDGYHDFILSVTDNDGVTTVKTLMLRQGPEK